MPDSSQLPRDARDVDALVACLRGGARAKYVLFWGHEPPRGDRVSSVGPICLSQWYAAEFEIDGVRYSTAEHWMMAEKARLFGDDATLAKILAPPHPGAAKQLGRCVSAFDQSVWDANRFEIVVRGSVAKFGQNDALREFLVGTSSRVLVEASPRDRVWGIGLSRDHPHAEQPEKWRGLNLLGFALMEARQRLE